MNQMTNCFHWAWLCIQKCQDPTLDLNKNYTTVMQNCKIAKQEFNQWEKKKEVIEGAIETVDAAKKAANEAVEAVRGL